MGRKPRSAIPPQVPESRTISDADKATEAFRARGTHRRTNGPSNEIILKHIRLTDTAAADDASAHSDYMTAIKAAEADGVDKKALKDSRVMKKKVVADVIGYYQKVLHYLELRDMPITQTQLFPPADSPEAPSPVTADLKEEVKDWDAEEEGYAAYNGGRNSDDHRHPVGSSQAQAWRRGWNRADAEAAEAGERPTASFPDDKDPPLE